MFRSLCSEFRAGVEAILKALNCSRRPEDWRTFLLQGHVGAACRDLSLAAQLHSEVPVTTPPKTIDSFMSTRGKVGNIVNW